MPKRNSSGKDREVRLILGIILLIAGLSGFGMMNMMGYWFMGYTLYGNLISLGLVVLGGYLIYDGLKK